MLFMHQLLWVLFGIRNYVWLRLKFLQFGCQCSKMSLPQRGKRSLHHTVTFSAKLVRKANLARMLYVYLLFSKWWACHVSNNRMIKAMLLFKIELVYLISLPLPMNFGLALNCSNTPTCTVLPPGRSVSFLQVSFRLAAKHGRAIPPAGHRGKCLGRAMTALWRCL